MGISRITATLTPVFGIRCTDVDGWRRCVPVVPFDVESKFPDVPAERVNGYPDSIDSG
jgi:hypothetical protein